MNYFKFLWAFALFLGALLSAFGQENKAAALALGTITPYPMEVTYDKTSHLIFPSSIRYVDLGSEYLLASKAQEALNVLRVKAAVRDFEPQTNFSVITDDGHFYSFSATYSPCPNVLSYDLQQMFRKLEKAATDEVHFEELGTTSATLASDLMKTIYKNDKRIVKHIGSKCFGVAFLLKGLYIYKGKYYLLTQINNRTNIPYRIDFVNFKVVDKKAAKRTAVQERPIVPLRVYQKLDEIGANAAEQHVFLLDQFTIGDDKVLFVEIFEKNGGRHQGFKIKNSDLVKAQLITDSHAKL